MGGGCTVRAVHPIAIQTWVGPPVGGPVAFGGLGGSASE